MTNIKEFVTSNTNDWSTNITDFGTSHTNDESTNGTDISISRTNDGSINVTDFDKNHTNDGSNHTIVDTEEGAKLNEEENKTYNISFGIRNSNNSTSKDERMSRSDKPILETQVEETTTIQDDNTKNSDFSNSIDITSTTEKAGNERSKPTLP